MMKITNILSAAVLATAATFTSANAATMTADADAFSAGTLLNNAFAGVTLSSIGGGYGAGPNVYAVNPSTQSREPYSASTGSLVFGTNDDNFPHLYREPGFLSLRADFAGGADSVSIDYISNDSADTGLLQAFSAGGSLLGSYTTASLSTSNFETMTISGVGPIAYIIAGGDSGVSSGGLDNLSWDIAAVPVPGALPLLLTALGGAAVLRRRAKS